MGWIAGPKGRVVHQDIAVCGHHLLLELHDEPGTLFAREVSLPAPEEKKRTRAPAAVSPASQLRHSSRLIRSSDASSGDISAERMRGPLHREQDGRSLLR